MTNVTIEGSLTPSQHLARGKRKTVVLDEQVQRWIDRGFVTVISKWDPEPVGRESVAAEPNADGSPSHNATTDEWKAFFDSQQLAYPEDVKRKDLIAAWELKSQQENGGS